VLSHVDTNKDLQLLIRHGYVVAAVDVRGAGASFGENHGIFPEEETQDAYEITEWLARQPWCDGNIGMYGGSYLGITQFLCASRQPPHLKAIFPHVAAFDLYNIVYSGGIYRDDFLYHWGSLTRLLDSSVPTPLVDEDTDSTLYYRALEEHKNNWNINEVSKNVPFRDHPQYNDMYGKRNPAEVLDEINKSGVPVYQYNGWLDVFSRGACQWFVNLETPQKWAMGIWAHNSADSTEAAERIRLLGIEQLRWFDYWLKKTDNGIMDEAPINYATLIDPGEWIWNEANEWPLPDTDSETYFFTSGPSNSVKSVNDGILSMQSPEQPTGFDAYTVDYSTTSGPNSRWDAACGGGPMNYPDMTGNDIKGLTYTTPVLTEDITVTGHPVVTLYITSTAKDGDFYVYLEEVDENGFSHYISEGELRGSHRALTDPPYNNLGLPYHSHREADLIDLPGNDPEELTFDIMPVSMVFNAGHRIRVTVTCADKDNMETLVISPPPVVNLYRNNRFASKISLPVVH